MESKAFPGLIADLTPDQVVENGADLSSSNRSSAAGYVRFGWLVLTSLGLGIPMALLAYFPCLLISLGIPKFRPIADRILQKCTDMMLRAQWWLDFETSAFERALAEVRADAARRGTGVLLVANHRSHLDMFLLLARVVGIRVLAKRELFAVPFLGLIMWTSRQIPVRRRDLRAFVSAMDTIADRLAAGEVVHVFPEMTRAEPGFTGVAGFNPAPFLVAQKLGAPILPLAIQGTGALWPKGTFAIRAGFAAVEPLAPVLEPAAVTGAKELAEVCRARIAAALGPEGAKPLDGAGRSGDRV